MRRVWSTDGIDETVSCQSNETHFTLNVFQRIIKRRHRAAIFSDEL